MLPSAVEQSSALERARPDLESAMSLFNCAVGPAIGGERTSAEGDGIGVAEARGAGLGHRRVLRVDSCATREDSARQAVTSEPDPCGMFGSLPLRSGDRPRTPTGRRQTFERHAAYLVVSFVATTSDRTTSGSDRRRFDPVDGRHTVDGAIERSDPVDPGGLGTGDEVRLGEVDAVNVVDLHGAEQERRIHTDDRIFNASSERSASATWGCGAS